MSIQPEAPSAWNILPEDLDCEKNPFLQMSQDQIQKLDAVLSSEQARALLRESSNDKIFTDCDKLNDVLSHTSAEDGKLPAVLEETLGVSFKDLEHLVLEHTAASDLFPEASVGDMASDILDLEGQGGAALSVVVWLDHAYCLAPSRMPDAVPPPLEPVKVELASGPAVITEVLPQSTVAATSVAPKAESPSAQPELRAASVVEQERPRVVPVVQPERPQVVPLVQPERPRVVPVVQQERPRMVPVVQPERPLVVPVVQPEAKEEPAAEEQDSPMLDSVSESDQRDEDEESSARAGPRRRSQRQIEKLTREQVEKIRAENVEMEKKEREEMERKMASEVEEAKQNVLLRQEEPKEEALSELEAVVSELARNDEAKPVVENDDAQKGAEDTKDKSVESSPDKKTRKRSRASESERTRSRSISSSSIEGSKVAGSPTSKSPKERDRAKKSKRSRSNSESVSPSKKVEDEEAELKRLQEEKNLALEKKKKKLKKEKTYEEPEPALFSLPDKMIIKGKGEGSPDGKPQRKDSVTDNGVEDESKKAEPQPNKVVKFVKVETKPILKKELMPASKQIAAAKSEVNETVALKKEVSANETAVLKKVLEIPAEVACTSKQVLTTVKKEGDMPQKIIKRAASTDSNVKKPIENLVKLKPSGTLLPDNVKDVADKPKPASIANKLKPIISANKPKTVLTSDKTKPVSNADKPKPVSNLDKTKPVSNANKLTKLRTLSNSDSNLLSKDKRVADKVTKKIPEGSVKSPTKTNSTKSVNKPSSNHKGLSKSDHRKNKSGGGQDGHKHRERRTVKRKPLAPNEIHPDEVSEEDLSDDPNDSDWESEDDPEKLWCICKQPSNDRFMIQCDPCSNWFHGTCVNVTKQQGRQMEKDGVEWHCPECNKNKTPVTPAVVEAPKPKTIKREFEPRPKHVPKLAPTASPVSSSQCIVCKSGSKRDSVYCGDACIEQHVKEVLKLLSSQETKADPNQPASSITSTTRVVVMERWTGKLYTGPNAPTQEALLMWLKANPTFEALKPGPSSSVKKVKGPEKEEKLQDTTRRGDSEPIRLNVRKTLKDILCTRCKDANDISFNEDAIGNAALKIEEELFKLFKDVNSKYKAKYRSLMFNVKDPRNQGLFRKIVNRKIPPSQLVRMSPEELASKELAKWRERENQHTLEMIKKDQLENQQMGSLIIKKTHKGEVEIEDDNLAILDSRVQSELPLDQKEERVESKGEDMSDITAMLSDTTNEHRMHLFDLNCQICTGRKAISELQEEKASPDKKKMKVARTISMEKPLDSQPKEGPVVVNPRSLSPPTVQKEGKEKSSKDKKHKKSQKKSAVPEETADHEPTSTVSFGSPDPELKPHKKSTMKVSSGKPSVWKGFIFMLDVTKFVSSAHKVSGPTGSLSQEIPDTIQVCGRIPPEEVWSYLSKIKQGGTKELIVMRFQPANEEEKGPYESFYHYLNRRKRYGVVRNSSKMIKDFYIIPLGSHSPVPTVLMPFDGPGLNSSRPNLLLGVIVRHKHKAKVAPPAPAPVVNPVVERYDLPERSYTPPLDALPCQSTTVDSSNSTNGPAAANTAALPMAIPTAVPTVAKPNRSTPPPAVPSPVRIPGIMSPSTITPSSIIESILTPKILTSGNMSTFLDDKAAMPTTKKQSPHEDEPYEPSYTPPLEKSKFDEDKPYDPDDLDELEVQPKVDVRSFLDAPSPVPNTNPDLEAQCKLLAELTRQVEEQKEQIEMQKSQVLAAAKNKHLQIDNSDILLPEMLQSILKNIQTKSGGDSASQADGPVGAPIPVRSTSLSSMSARELVERAQRELADLNKVETAPDHQPPSKKLKHNQNPIPTIGETSSHSFSQPPRSVQPKLEPPPPGVDVEEFSTDYNNPPYYTNATPHQVPTAYPALAPAFQQPYYPPPHSDPFHPVSTSSGPPPHPPPHAPPPPQQQQQWGGHPNTDSGSQPPWPVNPPADPFFSGSQQWGTPWNQPPPPPRDWNQQRPPWNSHGQDTDARDSDLRMFQRRDIDRHYGRDRNRK